MTKIVLNGDVTNIDSALTPYNQNFRKIEAEFQDKVLYRDNPEGEPNAMENPLDMNGNRIYNLPQPQSDSDAVRYGDLADYVPLGVVMEVKEGSNIDVDNTDPQRPIINNTAPNVNANWDANFGPSQILNKPEFGSAALQAASDFATAAQGELADTALQDVVSGSGIIIDKTDPKKPVITATGGGGGGGGTVEEVVAGSGISVSSADPTKPVVTNSAPNVQSDWNAISGEAQILNKPTLGTASEEDSSYFAKASEAMYSIVPGAGINVDDSDPSNPIVSATVNPVGSVDWHLGFRSSIPAGYIPLDGQEVARNLYEQFTDKVDAEDWAVIDEVTWQADPSMRACFVKESSTGNLRVPDLNGKSVGAIDRVFPSGDGGQALAAGVIQEDRDQKVIGTFDNLRASGWSELSGAFTLDESKTNAHSWASGSTGSVNPVKFDNSLEARTGTRGNPVNTAGVWIIKVADVATNPGEVDIVALAAQASATDSALQTLVNSEGQISTSGTATFTKSTNNIEFSAIVGLLKLEVGDVIQISGSTSNDNLYTVESITDADNLIVNYEHRNGAGSLSLADETGTVTVKRIAKWFAATVGLGQAWVDVTNTRAYSVTYTSIPNRTMSFSITDRGSASAVSVPGSRITIAGVEFLQKWYSGTNAYRHTNYYTCPPESEYLGVDDGSSVMVEWKELR